MAWCPTCHRRQAPTDSNCRHCGGAESGTERRVLADGGSPDSADTDTQHTDEDASGGADDADTSAFSRRALLGYGGGSALLTVAGAGGLWFALVYEDIGPEEAVVREYFNAIDRSNYATAEAMFHSDSPDSSWANDEIRNLLRVDLAVEDTTVRERYEAERESVQEYALVVADVEIDNGEQSETFSIGIMVAQNADGEWRIWRDESRDE